MFKNQRHAEILDILKQESFAEVRTLAERLYASQPTIRRDLDFLEKQGYIYRSHGGAMLADGKINAPVSFRKGTRTQEKLRICRLAATLIPAGAFLFTDASTTVAHLADCLNEENAITVMTNGYPICRALAEKNIRTFSTGGRLLKHSMAFVGQYAEETVSRFHADLFFFSSSSLSSDGMISDYSEEEIALRRTMQAHCQKSVFLCDSGKFNSQSAFYSCSLSDVAYTITDSPLPEDLQHISGFSLLKQQDGAWLYQQKELTV